MERVGTVGGTGVEWSWRSGELERDAQFFKRARPYKNIHISVQTDIVNLFVVRVSPK